METVVSEVARKVAAGVAWLANEIPVWTVVALNVLWVAGVIDPVEADRWLELVAGVSGSVLALVFRENNDGPVTLWRRRRS